MNGGNITTNAGGSIGLVVQGSSSTIAGSGLTVQSYGDSVSPPDTGAAFNNGAGFSDAPGLILTDSILLANGAAAFGVYTANGGSTALSGDSISTGGDFAPAVWASGFGSIITASDGTQISTGGSNAYGVQADSGGQVTLSGSTVTTSGSGAYGLYATGADGESGVPSTITATNVAVTTGADPGPGTGAVGVLASAGGQVSLTGVSVLTYGANAPGIQASGGDGEVAGQSSVTTAVLGGETPIPTTVTTTGANSPGVQADTGGQITLNGGTVMTSGTGSAGLYATGVDGDTGALSTITANGTTIATTGSGANGVQVDTGGQITLNGAAVSTAGTNSAGVSAGPGGKANLTGGAVLTTGTEAWGIIAYGGGAITLSGTSITATGDGSMGLSAFGTGSSVTASNLTVTTKGTVNPADGVLPFGVYNGPGACCSAGGVVMLDNVNVITYGASAPGVFTNTGGVTTLTATTVTTAGLGSLGVSSIGGGVTNLSGGSVATLGQDAHALFVTGSGSQANLSGSNMFATQGAGAIGFYATAGGVVTATGPVTIATIGGVSPSTGLGAFGVNADGAGSHIALGAATITTSGAGATGLFASDAASSGAAGSITVAGTLTLKTTNPAAAAVGLQGNGASIFATGGGTIASAGDAIDFLGGKNQIATFDNFTIANTTGNLIFADPSAATINFNNTTANAGTNNLVDATGGSSITLNANASTLTGAIQTDSASSVGVNLSNGSAWSATFNNNSFTAAIQTDHTSSSTIALTNGSIWTMDSSSSVSNLAVANSTILFAPPGSGAAFKTLTVGSYSGAGANLTMNTFLGGTGSKTDELVINGGTGPGTTSVTINNATVNGVKGPGAQTTGNGIEIVAVNGGPAAGTFALANTPVVGGYKYSLDETNNDWFLVSSPTSTQNDIANSVTNLAKSQQQLITTNRILDSILIGATEQVNCSNCSSGFGSVGSYALGAHGRHSLTDELTVIGGFSYGEYSADGVTINNAASIAGSLIYDFVNLGRSRPFVEVGGGATPFEDVKYSRTYANGATIGTGYGEAVNRNLGLFGRVGWVDRLTPIDEAAVYGDISRSWMIAGGYSEATGPGNPYPATVQTGLDTLNVARFGGQYTHLFNGNIEVNVSAAVAYGFGAGSGNQFSVVDFGTISPYPIANSYWLEYGGRVGYRLPNKMVLDAFLLGTAFGEIGKTLHGGAALRLFF